MVDSVTTRTAWLARSRRRSAALPRGKHRLDRAVAQRPSASPCRPVPLRRGVPAPCDKRNSPSPRRTQRTTHPHGHVVHHDDAIRAAVIRARDGPKPFLSGGVPLHVEAARGVDERAARHAGARQRQRTGRTNDLQLDRLVADFHGAEALRGGEGARLVRRATAQAAARTCTRAAKGGHLQSPRRLSR